MLSAKEIASKKAQVFAQLTAGGTNAQMKEWYQEYKKLDDEFKAAQGHADDRAEDHGQGPAENST
ncbi:hypothetical protein QBC33DRAFT_569161 [Phialemonium atrogriseum]|uniref:Uncharacterized protein n=1 Tax=Phialemonium atrogriseum TaxID=1093897 RepID=A0AAJ0FMQ6_9PEZI|nr:uncharacterized protein QBC33DRAFT_569161 [Phialemonium atrogriseum]KAK1768119.1 hypothetical protein QBC33DRAFT_569161 [Phialemonium atrogriseum]